MTLARRAHPNVDLVLLDGANDVRLRRRGEPAHGAAARAPPHCRHRRPGEQKLDDLTLLSKLRDLPEGFHATGRRAPRGDGRLGAADAAASRAESGSTASSRAEVERARWDPPLGDDTAPLVGEWKYPLDKPHGPVMCTSRRVRTGGHPGVDKQIMREGSAAERTPKDGDTCFVHYDMWQLNASGEEVWSTRRESEPHQIVVGKAIPASDGKRRHHPALYECVRAMVPGERALFRVPPELCYGEAGNFSFPAVPRIAGCWPTSSSSAPSERDDGASGHAVRGAHRAGQVAHDEGERTVPGRRRRRGGEGVRDVPQLSHRRHDDQLLRLPRRGGGRETPGAPEPLRVLPQDGATPRRDGPGEQGAGRRPDQRQGFLSKG